MEKDGISGLVGIGGTYKDRILEEIQLLSGESWSNWKTTFPETRYVVD
jgi:hypothetical protein